MSPHLPQVINSDGQSSAARAALDWAIKLGLEHDGWRPKHKPSLPLPLEPEIYHLRQTPSLLPYESVERNVKSSDGVLIFTLDPRLNGKLMRTMIAAGRFSKPRLHVHAALPSSLDALVQFLTRHRPRRLHINGSAEAQETGIYEQTLKWLNEAAALLEPASSELAC